VGIVFGVARVEGCSGFGSLADNFLLCEHRQKSQEFTEIPFGQFRLNSFLRFLAKNSNARCTKSPRIRGMYRPRFLAEIPIPLHKLSFKCWQWERRSKKV